MASVGLVEYAALGAHGRFRSETPQHGRAIRPQDVTRSFKGGWRAVRVPQAKGGGRAATHKQGPSKDSASRGRAWRRPDARA